MALIKCPECGQEVSNLAPACIHCGYPFSEEQVLEPQPSRTKQSTSAVKKNLFTKRQKAIAVICVIAVILAAYFGFFHLGTKEKYAYDLVITNAWNFKNPKDIEVLSGTANWLDEEEEPFAFVCLVATNSYGAKVTGYYSLTPDYVHDVSYDKSLMDLCKSNNLNVGSINRRIDLYWLFH